MPQYVLFCEMAPFGDFSVTKIHELRGFEAASDKKDMLQYLLVDPGGLKWEQSCPGAFYIALSRARTFRTFSSDTVFPRDSAIY